MSGAPPRSVFIVLLASTSCGGLSSKPCEKPLDAYCVDCPTFDEALDEEATLDPYEVNDAHVVAYECGAHHLAINQAESSTNQTRYYDAGSELLVGVDSSQDVVQTCGSRSSLSTVYGNVPDCEATCVLFERCPDDAPCESTLEACER